MGPSLSFCEPPQLLGKVTYLPEHIPIPPFPTSRDFPLLLTSQVPGIPKFQADWNGHPTDGSLPTSRPGCLSMGGYFVP